ncbi:hypothetical protein [Bauldia litoralis]|nr:hypothetical protein [Bauldia litoralis]
MDASFRSLVAMDLKPSAMDRRSRKRWSEARSCGTMMMGLMNGTGLGR